MSDELLSRCLYHINKLSLSVPADISIISISDGVYPYLTHPQVSHVKDSGSKMGKNATKLLIGAISGELQNQNYQKLLTTKLVELESVDQIGPT